MKYWIRCIISYILKQKIKEEIHEIRAIIELTETILNNLLNFLSDTLPSQDPTSDQEQFKGERKQKYDRKVAELLTLMSKKAEKVNSVRRNSFAFTS